MKLSRKLILILSAGLGAGFLAISGAAVWQMQSQGIAVAGIIMGGRWNPSAMYFLK